MGRAAFHLAGLAADLRDGYRLFGRVIEVAGNDHFVTAVGPSWRGRRQMGRGRGGKGRGHVQDQTNARKWGFV